MRTPVAALINLLGYLTGVVLYAMLLAMVLRSSASTPGDRSELAESEEPELEKRDWLPLFTALIGLVWNLGVLLIIGLRDFGGLWVAPLLSAAAFSGLGFLPAVVVHSVLRTGESWRRRPMSLTIVVAAYALSIVACVLNFYQALRLGFAPSHWALQSLTGGFGGLIVVLLIITHGRPRWGQAGWVAALAVFAVSALHLSYHEGGEYSWWVELVGHHASLPLALAILYQDYRFALADLFLKRALALILLVGVALGLYLFVAAPLMGRLGLRSELTQAVIGLLLMLWTATALIYPWLWHAASRFVDAVLLQRSDYETVRVEIAQRISLQESPEEILNEVCVRLSKALMAPNVSWTKAEETQQESRTPTGSLLPLINRQRQPGNLRWLRRSIPHTTADVAGQTTTADSVASGSGEWRLTPRTTAAALTPTTDPPQYRLLIGELAAGRRLLSDDIALLDSVAMLVARRIDAVRVVHERCVHDLHEQEMRKLATEAELRALRAQINPHFLFNALTTIGYLIQAAPDRALKTLMRLTTLLRSVLRHSDGEFCTLGEELDLIESYLEIERARFEDRLRIMIDAPEELRRMRIPAFLIQPLVENAIKHGVSPQRAGGEVVIVARLIHGGSNQSLRDERLQIWVRDTGAGASEAALESGRQRGVGLTNIEQRIRRHFGEAADFDIRSAPGVGTTVELKLPVNLPIVSSSEASNSFELRRKHA